MHPILFTIGDHVVWSYGFFVTAGCVAGVVLFLVLAGRDGLPAWTGVDLIIWILPAALVGAKLLFILAGCRAFIAHPSPCGAGWSYLGALLGALCMGQFLFRAKRLDAWRWLDSAAPALALVGAVGRVGCLMAGCCWGAPTRVPWGIVFSESRAAPLGIPLAPTQLFYLAANLFIVATLLVRRKTTPFRGELILLFVLMYVTSRSIIDPFLGAPAHHWFLGIMTTYQLVTMVSIVVVTILYYRIGKKNRIERDT